MEKTPQKLIVVPHKKITQPFQSAVISTNADEIQKHPSCLNNPPQPFIFLELCLVQMTGDFFDASNNQANDKLQPAAC